MVVEKEKKSHGMGKRRKERESIIRYLTSNIKQWNKVFTNLMKRKCIPRTLYMAR